MTRRKRYAALAVLATAAVAGGILAGAEAGPSEPPVLTDVATANTRSDGYAPWSKLSVELRQVVVAQGSTKLDGGSASRSSVGYYGYDNDILNAAGQPQMVPTPTTPTEAHKTEPDKNTYLVFKHGLPGADPHYDYGTHFLFQGHEGARRRPATSRGSTSTPTPTTASRCWRRTTSTGANRSRRSTARPGTRGPSGCCSPPRTPSAPTYAATPGYPSTVTDVSGALGRGGYEGIQDDCDGNIWIAEDIGGSSKPGTTAKQPQQLHLPLRPARPGRSRRTASCRRCRC